MVRTKKVKYAGRFRAGYGKRLRDKLIEIESKQRKKQKCIFCKNNKVKRIGKGIFLCKKCNKKFTSSTYFVSQ